MEQILKTKSLTKYFGHKIAVDNVSMNISKGDIYGLIGKNGAGKTTLMRMILSLAFPTSGEIELFGGEDFSTSGKKIGSLIETPAFYKNCSAYENLKRFAILYGADDSNILELLELVDLADAGQKKAGQFSLGMKQRLGIAISLLSNPEFVILDEPVNGLDPEGMADIRGLIQKLNSEKGITFLISSHLLEELSKTVTRFGIIDRGKLIEEIDATELNEKCRHKLIIKTDTPEKASEILREMGINEFDVTKDSIIMYTHINKGAILNRALTQNGIFVSGIEIQSDGIEQYFLERIGKQ